MGLQWHLLVGGSLVCCMHPVWAEGIYAAGGQNGGAIHLSNVPTDHSYQLLIAPPPALAADPPPPHADARPAAPRPALPYDRIVRQAARATGLDSALLHAVISVESKHNPRAKSDKGAVGMMQLMPGTARKYGVVDPYNPRQNIRGGARYLRDLLAQFDGNVKLALAAYNAGERAVARYGNQIPPYPETIDYVPRVLSEYERFRAEPVAQTKP